MNKLPQKEQEVVNKKAGETPQLKPKAVSGLALICLGLVAVAAGLAFVQPLFSSATTRWIIALFFQCFVIAAAVLFCGKIVIAYLKSLDYGKRDILIFVGFFLLVGLAGLAFFYFYYAAERDIKIYDAVTYWTRTIQSRKVMEESIPSYLSLLRNTLSDEYNYLIAFPLATASYLFGVSFTGYCQSVFLVYYLPSCLLLALFALRLVAMAQKRKPGASALVACFGVLAISPVLFWPLTLGYADVAGVLVIALMLNISLGWDGISFSWKRNIIMAMLSLLLILSRRWYAYYIVGFYAALGLVSLIKMLVKRNFSIKRLALLIANLAMIAGIASAAILLLNPNVFAMFLTNNYSEAYAAFGGNGILNSLWYIVNHVGFLLFLAFFLGSVWLLQKSQSRFSVIHLLLSAAVAGVLFLSVQDMGAHHEYLVTPTIMVIVAAFAAVCIQATPQKRRVAVSAGLTLVLAINFSFAYVPILGSVADFASPLATAVRNYPKQLENYDAYHQIYDNLLERTRNQSATVYIVGEGDVMNPDYFRRINMPAQEDAAPFAMVNSTVALRDGFPSQMFCAEYILMVNPFSTAFSTVQQVSYQVYDMMLNDPLISNYYQLVETYPLEEHEALLYQKIQPVDKALVDVLKERLQEFYPDTPLVYEPAYLLALMEYDDTMVYYNFYENHLMFNKPPNGTAHFALNDTRQFNTISFELETSTPGLELVVENQTGEIYRGPIAEGRAPYSIDITGSDSLTVFITGNEGVTGQTSLYFQTGSLA